MTRTRRIVAPAVLALCLSAPALAFAGNATQGNDKINGTSKPDRIVSMGGNDKIKSKGGKDTVLSGSGNDSVVDAGTTAMIKGRGLFTERFAEMFAACGWRIVELRYGRKLAASFLELPVRPTSAEPTPEAPATAGTSFYRLRYPDGSPVDVVVPDHNIGGVYEAAKVAELFRTEGVGVSLTITPWEKNMVGPIEKAIMASDLGITPTGESMLVLHTLEDAPGEQESVR